MVRRQIRSADLHALKGFGSRGGAAAVLSGPGHQQGGESLAMDGFFVNTG
jgi:hypothetical protein